MKCGICGNEIQGYGNNGRPLVEGKVCNDCNWKVIMERLKQSKNAKDSKTKEATEATNGPGLGELDGVVVGGGGPVNVTTPMEDFERYAEQFENTFILGKTPIRKEKAENKTKVNGGHIDGEVVSLEKKEEKLDQVEPVKSATEALHGFSEIYEFIKLCKELGLNDYGWIQRFVQEHPGDPLAELRKYREDTLGEDWENRDLTSDDRDEIRDLEAKQRLAKAQEEERGDSGL